MSEIKQAILCFFRYVTYDNSLHAQGNSQNSATTADTNWDPLRRNYWEVMDDPPDNSDITPRYFHLIWARQQKPGWQKFRKKHRHEARHYLIATASEMVDVQVSLRCPLSSSTPPSYQHLASVSS
jgi:hypothetical protein